MGRELMWVCGILPETLNREIVSICRNANQKIGLPETVFRFPLHISMKKSFYTEDFKTVKQAVMVFLLQNGRIPCRTGAVIRHKGMLWLPVIPDACIRKVHDELDALLEKNYGIPISRFDRVFQPHVSLFTTGPIEQIKAMYEKLTILHKEKHFELKKFVVGSSGHRDEFFEV